MELTIGPRPDPLAALDRLDAVLAGIVPRVVACSGGVDSLVLATVADRARPDATVVAHTVTPAVPAEATARVIADADRHGWRLEIVRSREFDDERYLANPVDRCYHCKSHLYEAIDSLGDVTDGATVLSGANVDDLGEYRPGLVAADEHDVRHPYVEAGITKSEIRAIARHLGLAHAELPASPCLASRLYTGTRVTAERLRAVEAGEALVRSSTGIEVVRCRIDEHVVRIEVPDEVRGLVDHEVVAAVARVMRSIAPDLDDVRVDADGYAPGRAFVEPPSRTPERTARP